MERTEAQHFAYLKFKAMKRRAHEYLKDDEIDSAGAGSKFIEMRNAWIAYHAGATWMMPYKLLDFHKKLIDFAREKDYQNKQLRSLIQELKKKINSFDLTP